MPGGDRTGPMGQGPMTGRAMGFCAGYEMPGYTKGYGGRMGRGFGFGRNIERGFRRGPGREPGYGQGYSRGSNFFNPYAGFHHGFPWMQTPDREEEIKFLKSQSEAFRKSREEIEKRLSELEKEDEQGK